MCKDNAQGVKQQKNTKEYLQEYNYYMHIAHYLARILHVRPNEILDTWGTCECIVAYATYMNEESMKAFEEWKHMDSQHRPSKKPKEIAVKCIKRG